MRDNERVMVILIGEQPAPNLIPIRVHRPEQVVGVFTKDTAAVFERLTTLIGSVETLPCEVPPYDYVGVRERLAEALSGYSSADVIFNLTGATKIMLLGAYDLARDMRSRFLYLVTDKAPMRMQTYSFEENRPVLQAERRVEETISLHDYLCMYIGECTSRGPRDEYEAEVETVLSAIPELECMSSVILRDGLEVDFMVRYGNTVGAIEVKRGKADKKAIDQINSAATRSQLGTYIRKAIICGEPPHQHNKALAAVSGIAIIVLPGLLTGQLADEDRRTLVDELADVLKMRDAG